MDFITEDSGERIDYPSGMRRDTQEGKTDYTLLHLPMIKRWAELMTRGAEKYGRHNWKKADSKEELDRFKSSAFRHFMQWIDGETNEDHAAAVMFNIACVEYLKEKIDKNDTVVISDNGLYKNDGGHQ